MNIYALINFVVDFVASTRLDCKTNSKSIKSPFIVKTGGNVSVAKYLLTLGINFSYFCPFIIVKINGFASITYCA